MRTLLDKTNNKDTTALNSVADQVLVNHSNTGAKILTHFVLQRHNLTSFLRFLDQTETEGHLKQIGIGLGQVTLPKQDKDPGQKLTENSRSSRFDLKQANLTLFPRKPEV